MDLKIVTDTATRLVVQTQPDQAGLWALATGVCGVVALGGAMLWRRARGLAVGVVGVAGALYLWTAVSLLRTGGVIDEFTLDRAADRFATDSFYPRDGSFAERPAVRPLSTVLRADVEQSRNGAALVVTLRSGDRVFPLGHATRGLSNEFLIVDRMERLLAESAGH